MSYKSKSARRKPRSGKPYERESDSSGNLVDKVKSWLAPSSWLSYLTPSKDGQQSSGSRNGPLVPPQDSPPPTSTADQRQQHPSHAASQYEGPSNKPVHPDQSNVLTSTASSDLLRSGTRSTTANYRAALSLFEEALGNNNSSNSQPTDPQLTNNPADSSFVEEEIELEGTTDSPRGISDMDVQTGGQSTEQIFASDESQSTSIVRAHSPAAQVEGTELQEHTVQLISNPAFPNKANPSHRQRIVMISPKVTKGLSAELTRRLYSPAAPRLSPVHERREENVNTGRDGSPFRPLLTSHESTTSGGLVTLSRTIANESIESISRSPFRSPFYSGRTSFGGAASQQKLRVKRPRTESSPPVIAPLRVSVQATPTGSVGQSVMSAAAKRIMSTLNSLTSPLSDARKIPLRGAPPEMQAKRRRVSEGPLSFLSPPPITPLRSTKPSTQIVPSDLSPSATTFMGNNVATGSSDIISSSSSYMTTAPTAPSIFAPKVLDSHTVTSSSPVSVLTGLKFSAPPLPPTTHTHSPPAHTSSLARSPKTTPKMKSRHSGGKMTRPPRSGRVHVFIDDSDEEEEYHNPVAPPPQVGLSLRQGGTLPSFTFSSQLPANNAGTLKSFAPSTQLLVAATKPQGLSSSPGFSFASPTPVNAQAAPPVNTPPTISFGFSVPKPHLPTSPPSATPTLSVSLPTKKTAISFDQNKPSSITSPPLLLKNQSVVDALKTSEYQQFLPTKKTLEFKSHTVIDLTSTDEKDTGESESIFSQFAPPVSSWECERCLVNNKASNDKCVACTAPKPGGSGAPKKTGVLQLGSTSGLKFGNAGLKLSTAATTNMFSQLVPTTGSWECSVCLVSNKLSDDKCVACSAAKPIPGGNEKPSNEKPKLFPSLMVSSTTDWTCDTCLVSNNQGAVQCVACSASKPGALTTGSRNLTSVPGLSSTEGFKLGGGISLGGQGLKLGGSSLSGATTAGSSGGFKLDQGVTLGKRKIISQPVPDKVPLGGGSLLLGGGLLKPAHDSWSCDTCMVVNKAGADSCIACSASKPVAGGLTLGGGGLTMLAKPQGSNGGPTWTCDACLVENKPVDTTCVACTTPKPGSEKETKKTDNKSKSEGFQFGSTGGFKVGGGLVLGSSLAATSLLQGTVTTSSSSNKPTLQFGVPTTTTTTTFKLSTTNFSPGNLPATNKSLSGVKFGVQSTSSTPLTGIKLGGLGGIKLGGLGESSGNLSLTTNNAPLGGSTTNSLGGSLTYTAPVPSATTTASPLASITLGGANSASGIKFGVSLGSSSGLLGSGSPLKLGQSSVATTTSASSNLLTSIKMGGGASTTATAGASNSSPLTGIKLGGALQATPTPTLLMQEPSKLPSKFSFGNAPTSSFNFTEGQKLSTPAPGFQFGAATSSVFSTDSKSSKQNFTFGRQTQPLSMATPVGSSNQAEMQSPDNEMTVDYGQTQGASFTFGSTKTPQQATGTNIFGGTSKPSQNTSGFAFPATPNPTTGNAFHGNLAKPSFGVTSSAGLSSNVPVSSTSSFNFALAPQTTASSQPNPGFQFGANPGGMNTNFGSMLQQQPSQTTRPNMFSVPGPGGTSTTPNNRVIKRARRRKA